MLEDWIYFWKVVSTYLSSIWYGSTTSCSFASSHIEYLTFGNNLCNRSFGICKKMHKRVTQGNIQIFGESILKSFSNLSIASCIGVRNVMDNNDRPQPYSLVIIWVPRSVLKIWMCFFVNEHVKRDVVPCHFTDVHWFLNYIVLSW